MLGSCHKKKSFRGPPCSGSSIQLITFGETYLVIHFLTLLLPNSVNSQHHGSASMAKLAASFSLRFPCLWLDFHSVTGKKKDPKTLAFVSTM